MSTRRYYARDVASIRFYWDHEDGATWDQATIRTAALLAIHEELRGIRQQIDALGADGIHSLIRIALTNERAKRKRITRAARRDGR